MFGARHEFDVATAELLPRQNRGEELEEPGGQRPVVQHAFGREPAVHVLGVPHRPPVLELAEPALLATRARLHQLVESPHLDDVLAGRVPRPVPYDGRDVHLATLFGGRRQSRAIHRVDVVPEVGVHFLVPPFGGEVVGDRRDVLA